MPMNRYAPMLPKAQIAHSSPGRLRLRIAAKRGDTVFFEKFEKRWDTYPGTAAAQVNVVTGSILITGEAVSIQSAAGYGRQNNLFDLEVQPTHPERLISDTAGPLRAFSRYIRRISGGALDLPSGLFVALLLFGLFELFRGNWKTPPWYTAFWYAAGIYSKSLLDLGVGESSSDIPEDD